MDLSEKKIQQELARLSRMFFKKHNVHRYRMKKVQEMDDRSVIQYCHWFCEEQGLVEEFIAMQEDGKKTLFEQFKKVMSCGCKKDTCTEILFSIEGSTDFRECWMGKTWNDTTKSTVYWFGLTPDGKNAYDYDTFEEMAAAKVFRGRSLLELSDSIVFLEVDGLDPADRFLQLAVLQGEDP